MQEKSGVTFVYVTHDQSEALALSSRVAVMNLVSLSNLVLHVKFIRILRHIMLLILLGNVTCQS